MTCYECTEIRDCFCFVELVETIVGVTRYRVMKDFNKKFQYSVRVPVCNQCADHLRKGDTMVGHLSWITERE